MSTRRLGFIGLTFEWCDRSRPALSLTLFLGKYRYLKLFYFRYRPKAFREAEGLSAFVFDWPMYVNEYGFWMEQAEIEQRLAQTRARLGIQ